MKATRKNFTAKMQTLTTDQIINLMRSTWKDETGILFREIGFEIIDEREGEEFSDRIYNELWHAAHN